jgi:hypothetical protein
VKIRICGDVLSFGICIIDKETLSPSREVFNFIEKIGDF